MAFLCLPIGIVIAFVIFITSGGNSIFELGRRYSPYGRIYSHAVLNDNNIIFDKANTVVKGWAFIPQEGNTLLSTIQAYILQTGLPDRDVIFNKIRRDLIRKEW